VTDQPVEAEATAAEQAEQVVQQAQEAAEAEGMKFGYYWGTGRRKTAVARVRIRSGEGKFEINGRDIEKYFTEERDRQVVISPLSVCQQVGKWDVFVNVCGGGFTGQAGAIALGLARALRAADSALEDTLREHGLLSRDSRRKERKKYGRRGARRGFQFSKR